MPSSASSALLPPEPVAVRLLDGFRVHVGRREMALPIHAQRVLAYLALSRPGESQRRTPLAERLWPECSYERAQASLRTSLWRIRQADGRLVHADRERIRLDPRVEVDIQRSLEQASRLLADDSALAPDDHTITGLVGDLLPGWEDEWLVWQRERIRQVRIHALEALSHRLRLLGRLAAAIDAAYGAITMEPMRESAHAALIEVHLTAGNVGEARRQFDRYARLLWEEMRLKPSGALRARVLGSAAGDGSAGSPHKASATPPALASEDRRSRARR
jgi:DNA-binding SARP family transcriptional activator